MFFGNENISDSHDMHLIREANFIRVHYDCFCFHKNPNEST